MRFAKYVALAGLMIASTAGVTEASVINVAFYTTGVFSASGTNTVGNPATSVGITFTGVGTSVTPINVLSTDIPAAVLQNLGTFTVEREANNGTFNLAGSFTLSIFQSLPTGGTDTLVGVLEGQIKANDTGTGEIDFGDNLADITANIGIVTYTLTNLGALNVILLPDLGRDEEYTRALDGNITHTDDVIIDPRIPEPGTLALLGLGAVAGALRRRKSVI